MTGAGQLREVVDMQLEGEAVDEFGNPLPGGGGWETQFSGPARIQILRGTETVMAGRLQGTQTVAITMRWQPEFAAITSAWRAVNGRTGAVYNIRSVEPDERRAFVNVLADTGAA